MRCWTLPGSGSCSATRWDDAFDSSNLRTPAARASEVARTARRNTHAALAITAFVSEADSSASSTKTMVVNLHVNPQIACSLVVSPSHQMTFILSQADTCMHLAAAVYESTISEHGPRCLPSSHLLLCSPSFLLARSPTTELS